MEGVKSLFTLTGTILAVLLQFYLSCGGICGEDTGAISIERITSVMTSDMFLIFVVPGKLTKFLCKLFIFVVVMKCML